MINMSVNNVTGDIKQDKRLRVNFNIPEERKEVIQDNKCDECQRKLESKNSFSIHKSRIHRSNLSKKKGIWENSAESTNVVIVGTA